jgi:hypothetical protein
MTRTFSTITWGLALLLAAAVLAWQQSLPWALAAAGAVPTLAGLAKAIAGEDETSRANAAAARAARVSGDR